MNRRLVAQVREMASRRCDYCHMPERWDPLPFQVDHIIALQQGGDDSIGNLAWSCYRCNKHKGPNLAGIDPVSGKLARLFHPRRQVWDRHFEWHGGVIVGRTQ